MRRGLFAERWGVNDTTRSKSRDELLGINASFQLDPQIDDIIPRDMPVSIAPARRGRNHVFSYGHGLFMLAPRLRFFTGDAVKYLEHGRILPAFSYSVNLMLAENEATRLVIDERRHAQGAVENDHRGIAAEKHIKGFVAVGAFDRECFDHDVSYVFRLWLVVWVFCTFIVPRTRK